MSYDTLTFGVANGLIVLANGAPAHAYNPDTDLSVYREYGTGRLVDLFSNEKTLHDNASIGMVQFFEGPGPNPTLLDGYASNKVWLRQATGLQTVKGDIRVWNRSGVATSEANWVALTFETYRQHLRLGRSMTVAQSSATTWTITHNFGVRPHVQCWSSDWTTPIWCDPDNSNANQTVINHTYAIAGNVVLSISAEDAPGALVAETVVYI